MKNILSIIPVFLLVIIFPTSKATGTNSLHRQNAYECYDDTIVCDTLVEWEDVYVGVVDVDESESHFSVMGEFSSSLYKDKKFEYTTPEGCEYIFSVNPDGVSVKLEKGQARNVDVLTIPNGVTGLGSYFFVTAIGDFAFCAHSMLGRRDGEIHPMDGVKKLIIPQGIEYVGQNCFENAEDLEEVVIPSSLRNLGYCMFQNCEKLKSAYIPIDSKLTTIEDFVFMDCYALDSFYIPQSVQEIKQGPWRNCKSLEKLEIADDNYNFHVYDGVLYNRDRKHLIQYPAGKKDSEYYVGFGTQSIDNSAFYGNEYLSTVTFPASLDSISHIAFYDCSNLEDVVFNDVVEFIGNSAFGKCLKLKKIQLYGNPTYTYDGLDDPYNTFEQYTQVNIEKEAPTPLLAKSKGSIFDRIYLTVSKLPYFGEMEIPNNEEYGFPQFLGKGKAVVYGNAEPKEDILRLLSLIPMKCLAYEETDEKGRITRYYVDYDKKQVLYFSGGIGGNDLVVALFKNGDKKLIHEFIKFLESRKQQKQEANNLTNETEQLSLIKDSNSVLYDIIGDWFAQIDIPQGEITSLMEMNMLDTENCVISIKFSGPHPTEEESGKAKYKLEGNRLIITFLNEEEVIKLENIFDLENVYDINFTKDRLVILNNDQFRNVDVNFGRGYENRGFAEIIFPEDD